MNKGKEISQVIFFTENYDDLKILAHNRTIDQGHVKNLAKSISKRNLLKDNPIIVDKEHNILDGQHRYFACRVLGIGFFYKIAEEMTEEDISILNADQKNWKIEDYMNFYIQKGNINYIQFKEFMTSSGILMQPTLVLNLLDDNSVQKNKRFHRGEFIFPSNTDHIKKLIRYIDEISVHCYWVFGDRTFWYALNRITQTIKYDHSRMLKSLSSGGSKLIPKCRKSEEYIYYIEQVYNIDLPENEKIAFQNTGN